MLSMPFRLLWQNLKKKRYSFTICGSFFLNWRVDWFLHLDILLSKLRCEIFKRVLKCKKKSMSNGIFFFSFANGSFSHFNFCHNRLNGLDYQGHVETFSDCNLQERSHSFLAWERALIWLPWLRNIPKVFFAN